MLNYGIRYECTPFSPSAAGLPHQLHPNPGSLAHPSSAIPPAPMPHTPGFVLLPVSPQDLAPLPWQSLGDPASLSSGP
jgi:hypothetical protein